jgi:hypothetical protein
VRRVPDMGVLHCLFQPDPPMNAHDFDNTIYTGRVFLVGRKSIIRMAL